MAVCDAEAAGFSSGGPNALAVGARPPDGLVCCGLISSDGPWAAIDMEKPGSIQAQFHKSAKEAGTVNGSVGVVEVLASSLRDSYDFFLKGRERAAALADLAEASKQGLGAAALDVRREVTPWPFELSEVAVPVSMWHGTVDVDVPPTVSTFLRNKLDEAKVPGELTMLEDGTHGVIRTVWSDVLRTLVAQGRGHGAVAPISGDRDHSDAGESPRCVV
mmetsp:Transcript_14819/g.34815  ORF Transcript_14819/g.34815 Transcript_14819/m.34815 type:complete len:218 (+) Transcript_14819:15-668(+)